MQAKTILWPTDLSEHSLKAGDYVADLAQRFEARVVLLYVGFDLENYFPAYGAPGPEQVEAFRDWELAEAEKRMQKLCDTTLNVCPGVDRRVEVGDPARTIVKVAEEEGAEFIVIATRGRGGGDDPRPGIGSVTQRVAHLAPMSVFIVNPR